MSGSGFRGRGFGPRGARSNGPTNGFTGPRFPHPNFNHPRPPHRLPGHEKWVEGPNFVPWQKNKNFVPRPQYRGNLHFRPNSRGRAANVRGIIRFSGPGRPPGPKFCMGFIRNSGPRVLLPPEEQIVEENKSILVPRIPLLGSEEERQQKITETADKLKQKLSSITEEELTNFWEDDLSVLPNTGSEEENTQNKSIHELRHEPPELDLTFNDFRDIGRVDCNNSKFENVEDKIDNDDITITFENDTTNTIISTNEITVIHENQEESLNILDSVHENDVLNQSNLLLEDIKGQEQIFDDLPDSGCNLENLHLQCDNITEDLISSDANDVDRTSLIPNSDDNVINFTLIEPINDLINEKTLDLDDIETTSILVSVPNDQNVSQANFSENQNTLQLDMQDVDTQNTNADCQQNDHLESNLHELQDSVQTNLSEEEACQISVSDSSQNNLVNLPPLSEETQSNIACDSKSPVCSPYNEIQKLNNPPTFQPRVFNIPPRFAPRIPGPRCRWAFQQNGNNLFFRGPQRLPFHGNRMPPPRHIAPYNTTDLVPVAFDPRAPPPFTHNVPAPSHDSQHHALVPFSSKDLPPTFDPSEPPPNIRTISVTESSNRQEITQTMSPLDSRHQTKATPPHNVEIMQPPAFDPREPPPRISNVIVKTNENLLEFNPQQPPPKIHKRDETLQPPPIFDPRLSSQERSKLIAPLSTSGSHMMGIKLMETSQISVLNIPPVTANFSQPPPVNIPSHQTFIPNLSVNFQPVLPQANSGQVIVREFALPPPPISITDVPPPPPQELTLERDSNHHHQGINMDDGLEDMQEAMEFAKQIMNMTEEMKNNQSAPSVLPEVSFIPSEIPVPFEDIPCSSSVDQINVNTAKKQKKKDNKNKKIKQNIICGPELIHQKQEETETIEEEQSVQIQSKNIEDAILAGDQIRPKVVFNLNSKTKVIQKPEEWHRTPINVSENKEISQQITIQNPRKEKKPSKKHSSERKRNNINQIKYQQKQYNSKINSMCCTEIAKTSMFDKPNDTSHHQDYSTDSEKMHPYSLNVTLSNNMNIQKSQKSKKETRKIEAPISESSWKIRVINRFLKMSKNDICNMVNNSSLRKFDIAMKHLVKERRSSLSLEMRNTEDEKMKEYDREEFMTQLNAMLDPGAVVGITDLPTEFIHHLSEVLQLDPMPCDVESSKRQSADIDEGKIINQSDTSRTYISKYLNKESIEEYPLTECTQPENISVEHKEEKSFFTKEEPSHYSLTRELNLNISRENTNSSRKSLLNKSNPEIESTYKMQQPLFNEADLDDILSQVTERTRNLPNTFLTRKSGKSIETHKASSLIQPVIESFECNTFAQFSNTTAADLDDIFSAGIARAKSLSKSADLVNSRTRKSSSEDRNTFRSERYERWNRNERENSDTLRSEKIERWNRKDREDSDTVRSEKYERWNRKEQEDPDTFRNLTKEEWEAKYGSMDATVTSTSTVIRKSSSNSAENLNRDSRNYQSQRYCSSDSPMRHLSISPLTREASAYNPERCSVSRYNELEVSRRTERSENSSDSSTSSSSDSDEETVAPNVTKLLKVIKEKEKIAKKKTLNETIRDEVAAEIEKKWKEKNKYRERKSRKREKRKRDRREKRKKEKKKRRKRNSHSDMSKSSEQSEGFRLLTEDEIKKEVVVKEEPISTFEENIPQTFSSDTNVAHLNSTTINKTVESVSQIELQTSETEKHQVPVITCDKTLSQVKIKSSIISMTVQPKTKAQLKQMPESSDSEKSTEVVKSGTSNTINTNSEKINEHLEENIDNKIIETDNEWTDTSLLTNNFLLQSDVSLNIIEQTHTETTIDNDTASLMPYNTTNSVTEVNVSSQNTDQKALATGTCSTETKSSYRKIDIKAYKERALQRRLKEEAKLKENSEFSVSLPHDSQHSVLINKTDNETETLSTVNKLKVTEMDVNKVQLKDPRLAKMRSVVPSRKISNKEVREKVNLKGEHLYTDVFQKNKELSIPVQSTSANEVTTFKVKEKNATRSVDVDSNSLKDSIKLKDRKSDAKLLPQENTINRESEDLRMKVGTKGESEDKKSKKLPTTAESTKFKNIRSEGSKELKLKKDKKSVEKKKKSTKSKSSVTEKDLKHPNETEDPLIANADGVVQTETERTDCNPREPLQSEKVNENLSDLIVYAKNVATEPSINCKINKGPVNTHTTIVLENDKRALGDSEVEADVNNKILENQQIINQIKEKILGNQHVANQEKIEVIGNQSLLNSKSEENNAKESGDRGPKNLEISGISSESVAIEKLNKEEDVRGQVPPLNDTLSDCTEKCIIEDKSVSNTIVSAIDPYYDNEELHFTKKDVYLTSGENLEDGIPHSNSISRAETNSEVVGKSTKNSETRVNSSDQNRSKSTLRLKDLQVSGDCNKVGESEVRSPDSSGSPFKGFLSESIEDDILQVSQLYTIEMSNGDTEETATETPKEWLGMCVDDKLSAEPRHGNNKDDDNNSFKKPKQEDEPTSVCKTVKEQLSITENDTAYKTICDHSDAVDNIGIGAKTLETRDRNVTEETQIYNTDVNRYGASPVLELDSQNTFNEDGEPFIVLDEYIDDTDGRTIEKLSTFDLDLEDCIARDVDIFSNRPLTEVESSIDNVKSSDFNSINFKELSEVFDTDNVTSELEREKSTLIKTNSNITELFTDREKNVPSVISSEPKSKIQQNSKVIDPIVPEITVESLQTDISLIKDINQGSPTLKLSYTELEKTEQKNLHCIDVSGNNLQSNNFEFSDAKTEVTCSKILAPLNAVKAALTNSLENLSLITTSMSEVIVEFPDQNKKTLELNQDTLEMNMETSKLNNETSELNKEISELNEETSELNKEISEINKETSQLNQESSELNKEAVELNQETSKLNKEAAEVNKETLEVNKEILEVNKETLELNKELIEVNKKSSNMNKEISELKKDISDLNKEISKLNQETLELNKETTQLNKDIVGLNKETVKVDKENSELNKKTLNVYKEISELNKETIEMDKVPSELNKETVEVDKEISDLNKKTPELNKEPNNYEKSIYKGFNHSPEDMVISIASEVSINKDAHSNLILEQEKSEQLVELITKEQKSSGKSGGRKEDKTLHKVKSKHSMKHKQQKKRNVSKKAIAEAVQSDTVKVKYPTTKEAIMARMIEIDVEIHKLMTEKMTLYQMLTNDALPTENNLQQNNTIYDTKEVETTMVRPRTPSALMSQLIQNIDASPVTNQCAKTTTEIVPSKDNIANSVQINKSKVSKHELHAEKRTSCIFICGSDNEEIAHHTADTKAAVSKKRKRQKGPERAVKWEDTPESANTEINTEEKQFNDAAKSILKKVSTKQKVTEQDSSQVPIYEINSHEDSINMSTQSNKENSSLDDKIETPRNEASERIAEQIKSQVYSDELIKSKVMEQIDETISLLKDNEDVTEALNDTDTASSVTKATENRTPERSSIYSDDSTWDSLLQNPSDDQKKPTTGLALLEETYRKEMAKMRKLRVEARRKRRKKGVRSLLQTVNTLTLEEEELPLSTLYVKKLHQKKKLLNSLDQQLDKTNDDQQLWKNVDEIINAVAENRMEDLYMQKVEEQSSGEDRQNNMFDVDLPSMNKEQMNSAEANSESKSLEEEEEQTVISPTLKNIEEVFIEPSINSSGSIPCGGKDNADNDLQSALSSSKSQDLPDNEEAKSDLVDVESQNMEDSPGASIIIETNVIEPSVQQNIENNNLESNQIISVEDVDASTTESNTNITQNDQNILNILEVNTERIEEDDAVKMNKESNLQEDIIDIEKTVPVDTEQLITIPANIENNHSSSLESNNCNTMGTICEIITSTWKEDANIETRNMEEEMSKDSLLNQEAQFEKDDADSGPEKSSDPSKDELFISIQEQKMPRKRRESERSNKSSSEENNNRNRTTIPSLIETTEIPKSDEALNKKLPKRKRENSKTPLRRSSRYTEEITKRIKLEIDTNVQNIEQEPLEKNVQVQIPSTSPTLLLYDEEAENTLTNVKKSRCVQKTVAKKRCMPSEVEIFPNSLAPSEELKDIKRCKHSMPEMMNCKVQLVDSKHTILKPNVNPNLLRKYGISTINPYVYPNTVQVVSNPDHLSFVNPIQSMSTKDFLSVCTKQILTPEFSQGQSSKLVKKPDDVSRSLTDQVYLVKVKKGPKSMKMNLPLNDKEKCANPDIEVMPVLTKEQVIVDISQDREKPDIEIVEEKMIVTKNQHHNDSGSTLTVIETKDDKELPRTQYTVHKGPILDIKVFENSFLAASEDGRIYRYNQASNGILNIYKGHKAAVTCLYVYNTNIADINKEWMFSGSLDGTLRCYNVTTGIQVRDTADVGSPIQCMDEAWGIIFIGTKSGHVSRYHVKSGVIKGNSIQFSDKSVLALKATNEGPRRVLIVASRSQPITIRDAQNGLFLRTICGQKSHTVYSLMRDNNLIYCGTSTTSILVFDFTNGDQMMQYDAGVGIVCMRLYKQLLFAGCYDGNIYVFDTKDHRLVCSIPGPGNMLLSMEVIDNKIIAGSKDKRLQSWQMSRPVRALL
ncbi:uncharacterized protein LOC143145297 [Ptiloglossa arizonensis]|uniref:uncharacterized protein LOC143145297 n=1 Tax=Ptiloglossa arizonensis TaxID=3350558 RepID=UPI003FA11FDA